MSGNGAGVAAAAAGICTGMSLVPLPIGLTATATLAGNPTAVIAISSVKPIARAAVIVRLAGVPRTTAGSGGLAVSTNNGLSVMPTPSDVSIWRGGKARLAIDCLTTS